MLLTNSFYSVLYCFSFFKELYFILSDILNFRVWLICMISKNTIPYIGTEILHETCDGHNSTQNAPKSIILEDFKSAGHFPSSDSVKSRFKAIFKKWPLWIRRWCSSGLFAPKGPCGSTLASFMYVSTYVYVPQRKIWHWDRSSKKEKCCHQHCIFVM